MGLPDSRFAGPRAAATFIALCLLARAIFLFATPLELAGDGHSYLAVAMAIAHDGTLPPLGVQPRGYPLLIAPLAALLGDKANIARAVVWGQVLMEVIVVGSLARFAWKWLAAWPRARLVTCGCIALQPFTATLVNNLMTETSVQFLVLAGLLLLLSERGAGLAGARWVAGLAMLGLASILRLDVLLLCAPVVVLASWLRARAAPSRFLATCAAALLMFSIVPSCMLAYQWCSTGELGWSRPLFHNAGFMSWMRTWFAFEHDEHDSLAFGPGSVGWKGFDVRNYPARAFASDTERHEVGRLLSRWESGGYTRDVEDGFVSLARERRAASPLITYVALPAGRMAHYWINKDGAQTVLRAVPLQPPASTAVVAATLALRLAIVGLAVFAVVGALRGPGLRVVAIAASVVALRTLELGALGTVAWAGLMEVRYVIVAFPFMILLAVQGLCRWLSRGDT